MIELKQKSSKLDKNESEKFLIDIWLAIPEFPKNHEGKKNRETFKAPQKYQHHPLRETFEYNRSYTQAEIEEKFSNLITECNQKVDEIKPEQYFKIAIEWILPDQLLSYPIDCWNYRKNTKIGCTTRFHSVHIRSSQRLDTRYRDCVLLWRQKWDFLWQHFQQINLNNYILACQCDQTIKEDLEILSSNDDPEQMIVGINFSIDLQELENMDYEELIIVTGIPLALWPRCKTSNDNHIKDLDKLINPDNSQVLNLSKLPKYVRQMRQKASKNSLEHLSYNLCFFVGKSLQLSQGRKIKN